MQEIQLLYYLSLKLMDIYLGLTVTEQYIRTKTYTVKPKVLSFSRQEIVMIVRQVHTIAIFVKKIQILGR